MLKKIRSFLEFTSDTLLYIGGGIIAIQASWITYGVFMRYVMEDPDGMVTEATALLLVPLAFLGLSHALRTDAFPRVTIFIDLLSEKSQRIIDKVNYFIMFIISCFFTAAAFKGLFKSYQSGSASEILLWPRFYFWFGVAIALLTLSLMIALKFTDLLISKPKTSNYSLNNCKAGG